MSVRRPTKTQVAVMLLALSGGACVGSSVDGAPGGNNPPGNNTSGNNNGGSSGGTNNGGSNGNTMNPGATTNPGAISAGRVTMRRLNAVEYDNTVRDLIGLDLKPSQMFQFPSDEWGDGFFNDGDVLTASPLHIEKFLSAAQFSIDKALDTAAGNMARGRILICDFAGNNEASCLPKIVAAFAERAFRRPVTSEELAPYMTLVKTAKDKGESTETGLKLVLSALMVAPDFMFRIEPDANPGMRRSLNPYEIASRLSYFIYASMPDADLFARAKDGSLSKPEEITKQVRRMLADGKASAFSDAMSEQWMQTAALPFSKPNDTVFTKWNEALRPAISAEVRASLEPVLLGQVPATELLTAKYVYVNRALATFYGMPNANNVPTDKFEKVMVTDNRRGGVLRQASFLIHRSHPDTHAPTIRGKFILDRLLCQPPPPPPPGVPLFVPDDNKGGTLREKLTRTHLAMGSDCAACHMLTDPMGFAFENYDGIGQWRDKDEGLDVDATGTMPGTGVRFNGAGELSEAISKDPRFASCMAKQLLTYATGRTLRDRDQPLIEDLGKKFASAGMKIPTLVELIASSPAMTQREAE
ncbi:MAG TPA: DUF1592 domain-containing protein [Polyangia bacterium]